MSGDPLLKQGTHYLPEVYVGYKPTDLPHSLSVPSTLSPSSLSKPFFAHTKLGRYSLLEQWPPYCKISSPQLWWEPLFNNRPHISEYQRANRNQGTKNPSNKDNLGNQHLEPQSPQTQIPRHQHKNTIKNSQSNMSLLDSSYSSTVCPEYYNRVEEQLCKDQLYKDERWP